MVGLALIADLHNGASYAASVIPDVLNPAIRQRHTVPAHHVPVCVRLSVLTVLGVGVGVAHPVGKLEWMPSLVVRVVAVVTVMEGEEAAED